MRGLCFALGVMALGLVGGLANAQVRELQPLDLNKDGVAEGALTDASRRAPDGIAYDCYALDTRVASRWEVRAKAEGFAPEVWIARGALCNVVNPAHRTVGAASGVAELQFQSPGGRYLILVRSQSGLGSYRLEALEAASAVRTSATSSVKTAGPNEDGRIAIMRRQESELEARREAEAAAAQARAEQQRIALAQAEANRRAADQRRRQENSAFWGAVLTGTVQALNEVAADRAVENARMMEAQQRQLAQQQQIARHRQEQERLAREWEAKSASSRSQPSVAGGARAPQGQDQAVAEASARRLSQQQDDRRLQEQALIKQAEERRVAQHQRLAEAASQALMRAQTTPPTSNGSVGGEQSAISVSSVGQQAKPAVTGRLLTFQNPYGFQKGDTSVTLSALGLNISLEITDDQDILGQPRMYVRGEFCNTLTTVWSGGQRISHIAQEQTHASLRIDPGDCRRWSEWVQRGVTQIHVFVRGG